MLVNLNNVFWKLNAFLASRSNDGTDPVCIILIIFIQVIKYHNYSVYVVDYLNIAITMHDTSRLPG